LSKKAQLDLTTFQTGLGSNNVGTNLNVMKKTLSLLLLVVMVSCNCDHEPSNAALEGKWKLVAQLVDPGDGSGIFVKIASDKTLEFSKNATVVSNGSICSMDGGAAIESEGTFDKHESIIVTKDCTPQMKISYTISGNELILSYPCIEGCKAKYLKI
jgi:hypothetical protein